MSFFVTEHFDLPDGAFQDSIATALDGNGTAYNDSEGWGVIATYENADGALFIPDEPLTVSEMATIPWRASIKYALSGLEAYDWIRTFSLNSHTSAPEPGDYGTQIVGAHLVNTGSGYYERWVYFYGGAYYYWNGSSWTTSAANNVRSISLDTEYTLTITYDPGAKTFTFDNGADTATTLQADNPGDDHWWYSGIDQTTNFYGILKYDYIIVKRTEIANSFIAQNNLLTEKYHSNHFNGSALWALNDFTTEVYDDLIAKNDILDYDPVYSDLIALNRIGGQTSQIYSPSVRVLLNDVDVTSRMISYSISWAERFIKTLNIYFSQSVSAQTCKKNDENFQTPQIEILVDHDSSGTYVTRGEFFVEEISETISNGKFTRKISGRSKAALLDQPYSAQDTVSYESTTKRAIVCGLVEDAGLTCDWNLPDGPIEYHTFDAKTPIEIIEEIVTAIGGRISTDNEDKLYFYADDYTPGNHSPVLSIDSSDIHQVQITKEIPQSYNKVTVSGRANDEATFNAWAEVELVSVDGGGDIKTTLAADGNDYAVLVATVYDSEGALVDTELIEEESATPSDANTISVSKRITSDGVVGVWPDLGDGVPGTQIEGPYTFDDSTITTTGNMLDGDHLVTYYGGDTCSFSVDGPGVVEETSVLITNGQARTKLYGNELDAGTIVVIATYDSQDSNPVALILGDPRVGSLDANANPSSLEVGETSIITATVYDPDGDPVGDGYSVRFNILAGSGNLSHLTAATSTNAINDEEQVSNSYTTINVESPISSLTSIYVVLGDSTEYEGDTIPDDEIDQSKDYATGATTDGSQITLSEILPKPQTRVVVTYESGGTAQVVYTAPSSVASGGEEVIVEAWAGGLNHLVYIDVARKATTSSSTSVGGGKLTGSVLFDVNYTPKSSDKNGTFKLSRPIPQVSGYDATLGSFALSELSSYLTGGGVSSVNIHGGESVVVMFKADDKSTTGDTYRGVDDYVQGVRGVWVSDTKIPVVGAAVAIEWNGGDAAAEEGGDTETLETDYRGYFTFQRGVSGTHNLTITHPAAQNPDAPRGFHEYTGTIVVAGSIGTTGVRAIKNQIFYSTVEGKFKVPIIYR